MNSRQLGNKMKIASTIPFDLAGNGKIFLGDWKHLHKLPGILTPLGIIWSQFRNTLNHSITYTLVMFERFQGALD